MTQKNKELLLKDLCARLPYGVKCRFETTVDTYKTIELSREGTNGLLVDFDEIYCYGLNEGFIFPYLRPMNSMTDEEREEWVDLFMKPIYELEQYTDEKESQDMAPILYGKSHSLSTDWLNKKMFDYHGLIPLGIALEAPEDMYKIKIDQL